MKYNHNLMGVIRIWCIILWLGTSTREMLWADPAKEPLPIEIAHHYLKSYPMTLHTPKAATGSLSAKPSKTYFLQTDCIRLAERTQHKIVLRTLYPGVVDHAETIDPLLNQHAWHDLKLFTGTTNHPHHHVLARINRTTTVLGSCALATLLATPTRDIPTLHNRQKTIQLLLEAVQTVNALKKALKNYQKIEPNLLGFWTPSDPLYSKEYQGYMQQRFFTKNHAHNKIAAKLNSRIFFRNCIDVYGEFLSLPLIGAVWCTTSYCLTSVVSNKRDAFMQPTLTGSFKSYFPCLFAPLWSIAEVGKNYSKAGKDASLLPFAAVAVTHGFWVWRMYCGVKRYQEYSAVFSRLARRMRDIQSFMQTLQQVSDIVAKNAALDAVYATSLKEIRRLLASGKESSEVGNMVRNLLTMKFDHWSYFRGNGGKLLATYKLFEENKDHLKPAMYELGKLDSLLGIANLMQETNKAYPTHGYTFTKFLDRTQQKTPLIQFQAMWNPLLDPETVVTNEVAMDVHGIRNMVLCGPNAGGKSSFLSGAALALLLSQTFGIAPAQHAVITPFNKIHTYIEVHNDVANGGSLFIAELNRMYQYMHMLEASRSDEFIFAIMDEPFAGTNPSEAAAITYDFFATMAAYPNALHIMASHYPEVVDLEKDIKGQGIKNFKVDVIETADKKLSYNYKILPGSPTQTIALKLLEQKGYPKSKGGRNSLKHPIKLPRTLGSVATMKR